MPRDWNAERQRGAVAIEAEIDKQLASGGLTIFERVWLCHAAFEDGFEISYIRPDAGKVSAKFGANELKWYCRQPMPETAGKIGDIVAQLLKDRKDASMNNRIAPMVEVSIPTAEESRQAARRTGKKLTDLIREDAVSGRERLASE